MIEQHTVQGSSRIVVAGGSGFIGQAIVEALVRRDIDVVVLSRDPQRYDGSGRCVAWDGRTLGPWVDEVDGADAVINLAGKNVNCRYTPAALQEVDHSRIDAVHAMNRAVADAAHPPGALIQASTTAIFGDAGEAWCDEDTPPGAGIPVVTATGWERAFAVIPTPHTRRVIMRFSFVLGCGGVLAYLARLARCFLGGTVGHGGQYISWVHINDVVRAALWAIDHDEAVGVFNVATAQPVTNREFMRELRRVVQRPWAPPTPTAAVHVGAVVLRTEPVLALTGRRVRSRRLAEHGFEFEFTALPQALGDLLGTGPARPAGCGLIGV